MQRVSLKVLLLTFGLLFSFLPLSVAAANAPGTQCVKAGTTAKSGSISVKCVKSGNRLIWQKAATVNANLLKFVIGDTGPGGGKIFYISTGGFKCGASYTSTGSPTGGLCHYLEAAPSGWEDGLGQILKPWAVAKYAVSDVTGITNESDFNYTSAGIGLGYKNSLAIVAQGNDATTAAGAARAYAGGGKSDWYLPTAAELGQMCKWARGIAWTSDDTECDGGGTLNSGTGASGFTTIDAYWSSSEYSDNRVFNLLFYNGLEPIYSKFERAYVRPIRAF